MAAALLYLGINDSGSSGQGVLERQGELSREQIEAIEADLQQELMLAKELDIEMSEISGDTDNQKLSRLQLASFLGT